jgi:hypothetical protein
LLVDLNGERWRSEEIAMALARSTDIPWALKADFETPAVQTGFCGVAMPGVMLACALAAKPVASPAISQRCLVSTSSIDGARDVFGLVCVAPQFSAGEA